MIDKIGRRIYYMYIEKINGPEDVKKLNIEEMTALARRNASCIIKEGKYSRWAKMPAVNTCPL